MATVTCKSLRALACDAVGADDYSSALRYALQAQALGSLSRAKKAEVEMEWPANELQQFIDNMRRQVQIASASSGGRSGGFQTTKIRYEAAECE
jgi:hypothetical protein